MIPPERFPIGSKEIQREIHGTASVDYLGRLIHFLESKGPQKYKGPIKEARRKIRELLRPPVLINEEGAPNNQGSSDALFTVFRDGSPKLPTVSLEQLQRHKQIKPSKPPVIQTHNDTVKTPYEESFVVDAGGIMNPLRASAQPPIDVTSHFAPVQEPLAQAQTEEEGSDQSDVTFSASMLIDEFLKRANLPEPYATIVRCLAVECDLQSEGCSVQLPKRFSKEVMSVVYPSILRLSVEEVREAVTKYPVLKVFLIEEIHQVHHAKVVPILEDDSFVVEILCDRIVPHMSDPEIMDEVRPALGKMMNYVSHHPDATQKIKALLAHIDLLQQEYSLVGSNTIEDICAYASQGSDENDADREIKSLRERIMQISREMEAIAVAFYEDLKIIHQIPNKPDLSRAEAFYACAGGEDSVGSRTRDMEREILYLIGVYCAIDRLFQSMGQSQKSPFFNVLRNVTISSVAQSLCVDFIACRFPIFDAERLAEQSFVKHPQRSAKWTQEFSAAKDCIINLFQKIIGSVSATEDTKGNSRDGTLFMLQELNKASIIYMQIAGMVTRYNYSYSIPPVELTLGALGDRLPTAHYVEMGRRITGEEETTQMSNTAFQFRPFNCLFLQFCVYSKKMEEVLNAEDFSGFRGLMAQVCLHRLDGQPSFHGNVVPIDRLSVSGTIKGVARTMVQYAREEIREWVNTMHNDPLMQTIFPQPNNLGDGTVLTLFDGVKPQKQNSFFLGTDAEVARSGVEKMIREGHDEFIKEAGDIRPFLEHHHVPAGGRWLIPILYSTTTDQPKVDDGHDTLEELQHATQKLLQGRAWDIGTAQEIFKAAKMSLQRGTRHFKVVADNGMSYTLPPAALKDGAFHGGEVWGAVRLGDVAGAYAWLIAPENQTHLSRLPKEKRQ